MRNAVSLRVAAFIGALLLIPEARVRAITPEDPAVQAMVADALDHLRTNEDDRLGAKCLAAMAYLKTGSPANHLVVRQGVSACQAAASQPAPIEDVYSNGLAIILLCEVGAEEHRELIGRYLGSLYARQKRHGGWGYDDRPTGDTSQTQYAVLGLWSAHRSGIRVESDSVIGGLNWLMRTQDPSGAWGYQGEDPGGRVRVQQTRVNVTMFAAGLGSTLMCAHMLGISETTDQTPQDVYDLPPAVSRDTSNASAEPLAGADRVDRERLQETIRLAADWMQRNYAIESGSYNFYYLYALERYKSFEELVTGKPDAEPDWYQDGFELLQRRQSNGGWNHGCGPVPDTAFGILFLVRSTQKSIRSLGIGEGLLVGGRGLPQNVAQATVQGGRLFAEATARSVDELVQILEDPEHPQYGDVLADPRGLTPTEIGRVTEDDVPRLRQLIRGGEPMARLVSVQALALRDELDDVPTLIYALTDPDPRVVLAARDSLRLVSRRLDGFGLDDEFTDRQRYDAIGKWKAWYAALRPDAVFD